MSALVVPLRRAATGAAFAAVTAVAAVAIVPLAVDHAAYVAALPALLAAAVVAARYPSLLLIGLVAVTGTYGTITAYVPSVKAKYMLDGLAGALWIAALAQTALAQRRAERPLPGAAVLLVCLYLLATIIQAGASDDLDLALKSLHQQEWPLLLVLLGAFAPWPAVVRRRASDGVVVLAVLIGAYACLRYATHPSARELSHALADPANAGYRRAGKIDLFGSFTLPKDLGAWTAMALPLCLASAMLRTGWMRLAAIAACPLLVVANLGTNTRTALVAFLAGVLVVLVLHPFLKGTRGPRLDIWLVAILLTVGVGVTGFVTTQGDSGSRYADLLHPATSQSYTERQKRWENALNDVRDHPLGLGLGTAGFVAKAHGTATTDYLRGTVDSSYIKVALEQGLVTLLFIGSLVALALGLGRRAIRAHPHDAALALGASGAVVALLVLMYAGVYAETTPAWLAWLLAGLALGPAAQARERRASNAE